MDRDGQQLVRILEATGHGDGQALEQLMELVYKELRALAAYHLQHERPDHTLQPTALVHEAYLKMFEQRDVSWHDKQHFFRVAAQQIRRVLLDHARSRNRQKRAGKLLRVTLSDDLAAGAAQEVDLLALDLALEKLDAGAPLERQIVELKYFAGLTDEEIAQVLGTSERTVRRRWVFARTWLFKELKSAGETVDER
jgi:RNA polymerase sigma factor (TIGR02999 family)